MNPNVRAAAERRPATTPRSSSTLRTLVGSGDKIGLSVLPFVCVGLALNMLCPTAFSVGGPSIALKALSWSFLVPGVVIWLWSAALILVKVPRGELITGGPYTLVKHPLYTSVALLVLPWLGLLLNSWLGALLGVALYGASRRFAPEEERELSKTFGNSWNAYCRRVKLPWL